MKLLTALVALAGLALGLFALRAEEPTYVPPALEPAVVEAAPLAWEGEVPEGASLRTFEVEGMCCDGCAAKLYRRVGDVAGVHGVAIDPILGRAQVVVGDGVEDELVLDAFRFDKYAAARVAPASATSATSKKAALD